VSAQAILLVVDGPLEITSASLILYPSRSVHPALNCAMSELKKVPTLPTTEGRRVCPCTSTCCMIPFAVSGPVKFLSDIIIKLEVQAFPKS